MAPMFRVVLVLSDSGVSIKHVIHKMAPTHFFWVIVRKMFYVIRNITTFLVLR